MRYEAWQPPLFYLAAAPAAFGSGRMDDLARRWSCGCALFDAVIGALTLGVAYLVARELLPAHLAVAVPLAMVGVPMFTSVSASISADPLANLLAAGTLLVLVRRLRACAPSKRGERSLGDRRGRADRPGSAGQARAGHLRPAGAGCRRAPSRRGPLRDGVLLLGAIGVVVLPWLVHQVTTYGWTDPLATRRHAAVVARPARFPGLSPAYLADVPDHELPQLLGPVRLDVVVAPDRLYWLWGAARTRCGQPACCSWRRRLCASPPGCSRWPRRRGVVGYIGYNLAFEQFQGRYLFTALVPIAALLVGGWAAWLPRALPAPGALLLGARRWSP